MSEPKDEKPTIPFCCRYYHDGWWWGLTINAYDWADASVRCKKLGVILDGELVVEVPVQRLFGNTIRWAITTWRNYFKNP